MDKIFDHPVSQFIIGGAILAGGAHLGNNVSPFLAALVTAFPLELLMIFLIKKQEKRRNYAKSLTILASCLVMASLAYYFVEPTSVINENNEVLLSIIIWAILAVLSYFLQ